MRLSAVKPSRMQKHEEAYQNSTLGICNSQDKLTDRHQADCTCKGL